MSSEGWQRKIVEAFAAQDAALQRGEAKFSAIAPLGSSMFVASNTDPAESVHIHHAITTVAIKMCQALAEGSPELGCARSFGQPRVLSLGPEARFRGPSQAVASVMGD